MAAMTPDRWHRIQELYHSARGRAEADRSRFLAGACAGDTGLQSQVQALLDQPLSTGSFIDFVGGPASGQFAAIDDHGLLDRRLGSYHVLALLGRGGMGEVYRAHDDKLDRDVAIKLLPPAFAANPQRVARFSSEARLLAALNHPHIGAIYGIEDAAGAPALVLELVEGETLADRVRGGPLPLHEALAVARQIADALDAAHRKGIVHRDLKPANIKITPDGVLKVLDFGLAKAVNELASSADTPQPPTATTRVTRTGVILGTPGYSSPEQACGADVDARTDIWSFGCVLYELLTGRSPFTGQTAAETLAAVIEREPDWRALPSAVPSSIRGLLRSCLQKEPSRRLQDMATARSVIDRAQRGSNRWRFMFIATVLVASFAAILQWPVADRGGGRAEWVQLTQFQDSVIHPALSPDGRMVAFIHGRSSSSVPFARGQVFVKTLPAGEPVQLTNDGMAKMSPVFSPDGSRIAYTTVNDRFEWDTWIVPVLGGEPQLWLRNASGLVWRDARQILFAEMRKFPHMAIVAAEESRAGQYDVYVPEHEQWMAHLSYPSPDGQWVLVVEMDEHHSWVPCRVVPMHGRSRGRQVGPPDAGCNFAAWSPDGKWMYFTSRAGGASHIWRQRFPDGPLVQITAGHTEEEGIAVAADGRSLVTAVAARRSSLWLDDRGTERRISLEGNAVDAQFTTDGKLVYKIVRARAADSAPGELRVTDVHSGRSEPLVPGLQVTDHHVAPDGSQIVLEAPDRDGTPRLWVAPLGSRSAPAPIPNVEGRQPRVGENGEVLFRGSEGAATFVYRVRPDGTGLRQVIGQPVPMLGSVSPDGQWIAGWAAGAEQDGGGSGWQMFALDGRPSVLLGAMVLRWAPNGDSVAILGRPVPEGRSYLVPLPAGEVLPPLPAGGFESEQEVAALPGARRIDAEIIPGPSPDTYAFYRITVQRDLHRIPVR